MKNVLDGLYTKEQRNAFLTVLIVTMICILFFILVSLESSKKVIIEAAVAVEINEIEISSSSQISSSDASPKMNTQTIESTRIVQADKTSNAINDEADYLNYVSRNGDKVDSPFFGDDGLDEIEEVFIPKSKTNRVVLKAPVFESNTQEEGTIALKIWVDQDGHVIKTLVDADKSNSGSSYLINLARKAALTIRYNSHPGTPIDFVGTTTFVFKKV